jgi:uncharacterized membrane protein (UPF0127 family)
MTLEHPVAIGKLLRSRLIPLMVLALVAGGCTRPPETVTESTQPASPPSSPAAISPPVEMPNAVLSDGFEVTLELAMTPEELAQGLMFRPKLPDDRGMLLIFNEERLPSIWMMNTLVPLDLVYLDATGTVVDVITDAQPCPGEPCPRFTPTQPAKAVLEVPAGTAMKHEISAGQTLDFSRVPGFPSGD